MPNGIVYERKDKLKEKMGKRVCLYLYIKITERIHYFVEYFDKNTKKKYKKDKIPNILCYTNSTDRFYENSKKELIRVPDEIEFFRLSSLKELYDDNEVIDDMFQIGKHLLNYQMDSYEDVKTIKKSPALFYDNDNKKIINISNFYDYSVYLDCEEKDNYCDNKKIVLDVICFYAY